MGLVFSCLMVACGSPAGHDAQRPPKAISLFIVQDTSTLARFCLGNVDDGRAEMCDPGLGQGDDRRGPDRLTAVQEVLGAILAELPEHVKVSLVATPASGEVCSEPLLLSDHAPAKAALDAYKDLRAGGGFALAPALQQVANLIEERQEGDAATVLVLSTGVMVCNADLASPCKCGSVVCFDEHNDPYFFSSIGRFEPIHCLDDERTRDAFAALSAAGARSAIVMINDTAPPRMLENLRSLQPTDGLSPDDGGIYEAGDPSELRDRLLEVLHAAGIGN